MIAEGDAMSYIQFDLVGLDADDTLWHCEKYFQQATERFLEIVSPWLDAVGQMADQHTLVLVTKGDLLHQQRKLQNSGLAAYFDHVEIVSDKTSSTYRSFLHRQKVEPARFVMVGDSVKSDVLPVVAIGARAVHVPSQHQWSHEHAEHDGDVPTLAGLSELPAWLATTYGA